MNMESRRCPFCHSGNVLPHEEEHAVTSDSLAIILLAALIVVIGYFIFLVSSYLFFPFVVFAALIFTSRFLNRRERRKNVQQVTRDYLCIDCSRNFKA